MSGPEVEGGESGAHSQRAKCAEHGLAVGPDGKCVLCRRPSTRPLSGSHGPASQPGVLPSYDGLPSETSSGFPWFGLLAVLTVVGGGYYGYLRMSEKPAPEVQLGVTGLPAGSEEGAPVRSRSEEPTRSRVDLPDPDELPRHSFVEVPTAFADDQAGDEKAPPSHPNEMAAHISQVEVELYATSWCGYCRKTRAFFAANGINYREYDVETDSAAKDRKAKLSPGAGVPVVQIEGQVIGGYNPGAYAQAITQAVEERTGKPAVIEFRQD